MNPVKTIYLKEIREMLRDKRVRSSAFFGPMFMVAMFMFMFGFLSNSLGEPSSQKIHVLGHLDNAVTKAMRLQKMEVDEVSSDEEGRRMLRDGNARVVLEFSKDFDARFAASEPTTVNAVYNPTAQVSQIALGAVRQVCSEVNDARRRILLQSSGIDPARAEPIVLKSEELQVGKQKANDLLVSILPYLIVIWAFYGGISIVTELVAGEKEKNTLETLLIAPVRRTQIALGKFFALGSVCLLSSLSALAGVYVVAALHLPITRKLFEQGVGVSPQAALVIVLVIVPTVALFASLMLAVSTHARNSRESQSYLTLISFAVLMPAILSQFIGFTDAGSARWVNFVPVLNSANTIRQAMFGQFDPLAIVSTVAVSLVLAFVALQIAVRLFNREQVLTRV